MPTCSQCTQPSVAHLRYAGTSLCRDHFLRSFERRAMAEVARQGRMPAGVVAVALSGGKDSVALLHFLHGLAARRPGTRLVAITVDEGIQGYRDASLRICRDVTAALGVPWRTMRTRELAGYSIDEYAAGTSGPRGTLVPAGPRPACGPCGVFRREGLNRLARESGAAAVATGHNLDDVAQTVLMNHLKGDVARLARMAPHDVEEARGGLVPRIMPFRTIPEKEVLLYAVLRGLPIHQAEDGETECPYASRSHRFTMRDVLATLEAATPGTRHALVRGHERLQPALRESMPVLAMRACGACGQPTSQATCQACQLRA